MAVLTWTFEALAVVRDLHVVLVLGLSVSAILLLRYMILEGATAKVASYFYLVPPVARIGARLLFDEPLSALASAAIATTVLGVYLVVKRT